MRLVLMGVSGCGKTAIGLELSKKLKIPFYDADDFHSAENKEKMSHGIPLTDDDRLPWLKTLAHLLKEKSGLILGCSALKESYREILRVSPDIQFIYLKGTFQLIHDRLKERHGHFFDPHLLKSQFADLEEPKNAIVVDIHKKIHEIVQDICSSLNKLKNNVDTD
ncbi:MAG: gluconokinase [Chlamydiales bacterium]|nr:gluconokinase [Chlamydiales bacterium]